MKLGSLYQTFITATPKHSYASLVAAAGAALNLWSGITVIVLVEIIEMFYRILVSCSSSEKTNETSPRPSKTLSIENEGEKAGIS